MDFSTIILRFRDLVTESGKTIEAHKSIINNNNNSYVWWAWWKKGREKTPVGEFATLNEIAKDQKLKIFLLDSGNDKLYYAVCNEIKFSSTKLEESPEKDKTPEYYIYMANMAGVTSILIKHPKEPNDYYQKLVDITSWTEDDFIREENLRRECQDKNICPDFTIDSFNHVFDCIKNATNQND